VNDRSGPDLFGDSLWKLVASALTREMQGRLVFLFLCVSLSSSQAPSPPLKLAVDRTIIRNRRTRTPVNPPKDFLPASSLLQSDFRTAPSRCYRSVKTEIEHEYKIPGSYSISVTSPLPIPEISNNGIKVQVDRIPLTVETAVGETGRTRHLPDWL
jgi:hypothetical protein